MKLLLTSNGLTSNRLIVTFKRLLGKTPKSVKLLLITTGITNTKVQTYIDNYKKQLKKAGIKEDNIKVYELNNGKKIDLNNFGAVFVCGGNTYEYLYYFKKLGIDQQVKEFKGLYVGVSAGSYIICPSIKMSTTSVNTVGLKDLTGMNLVDFIILAHYTKKRKSFVDKLKAEFKTVIPLKDAQGLLVTDDKVKKIL